MNQMPGLSSRGERMSDLEAIHAAELRRYEESLASRSVKMSVAKLIDVKSAIPEQDR
jgi:hypothetical protein